MRKRRGLLRGLGAAVVVMAVAPPVAAQQTGSQDSVRAIALDRLRVTVARGTTPVGRLPAAFAAVGAADIRDGQSTIGLDESLDRVPGVFVNNRYNFSLGARISIRGLGSRAAFGVRGIRVIADGIPLTMPDGQTNLNNLELGAADRIQVLRGPASALYGNAAGGVIAIETEAAPRLFSTEARVLGGDAGRDGGLPDGVFKLQARAGGPLGDGDGWVASASRMETDGYRAFSRAKQTVLNIVARHAVSDNARLSFVVNAFDSPVAESPGALPLDSVRRDPRMAWPNNVRTGSGEATRQAQVGIGFAQALGLHRFDVAVYALGRDVDNALPFAYIDLKRRAGGVRTTWSATPVTRLALTAGVDIEWAVDDRREYDNVAGGPGEQLARDQEDQVSVIAPFVQALFAVTPRLDVLGGVRYDATRFETADAFVADSRDDSGRRTLSAASPMVGLSWAATPDIRLYGNVSTAFQTPTTTELINAPPVAGEACCPGGFNNDLDAQRAVSFEAGARGVIGPVTVDVAAYHMNVHNTIVPFQVADIDGREFFRNAGESRHRGIELSASTRFGRHTASLAWTLNDFVFVDDGDPTVAFEGNRLPGVPRQHLFAGIRLRPAGTFRIDVEADHTGEYFANDANDADAINDAATVLDVRFLVEGRVRGVLARPFVAFNNVTDERYNSSVVVNAIGRRYYEPAPGRSLQLGLSLATGGWSAR